MANTLIPSRVKAAIPSITGSMCERMEKLMSFVALMYEDVSYKYDENGLITDAFKADLCALGCLGDGGNGGGPPPNPSMPAPTGVNATDGSFADKIRVTWNAVTAPTGIAAVTQYKIYRSVSANTNPSSATLIATVSAPTATYDDPVDSDLIVGTTYNYWVVATNGTNVSAFSSRDVGSASAPVTTLDAVSDLRATVGFNFGYIALVWTPPDGATSYDVYRGTTNVFADATLLSENITPFSTAGASGAGAHSFWDNVGELVYYDTPTSGSPVPTPQPNTDFYYWVVAHKSSPPADSPESNSALGRIYAPAIYTGTQVHLSFDDPTCTVPAGITKMYAVLFSGGGGGGGGSAVYGGGGGGGGGVVVEEFTVAPGDVIDIVHTGAAPDTGHASGGADGDDGALTELKVNGVTVLTAQGGHAGLYNGAGGGAGGAADTASGTTSPTVYDGKPGLPAVGSVGGRSGYFFSNRRFPAKTVEAFFGDGDDNVGSGASAFPSNGTLAEGGSGSSGYAALSFGP